MVHAPDYMTASCALAQLHPKFRVTYGQMRSKRGGRAAMVVVLPGGKGLVNEHPGGSGMIRLHDGERLSAGHLATIAESVRAGGAAVVVADRLADVYAAFEDLLAAVHGPHVVAELAA